MGFIDMSLWMKLKARSKLIRAFRSGGIHLDYKMSDGTVRKIFPKIHSVKVNSDLTQYVFTLPNGLNPELLKKHYYVFLQYFGKTIELDGEFKKYVLTIHEKTMPSELVYKYQEISE